MTTAIEPGPVPAYFHPWRSSETAFTTTKLIGAAYLVWLGIKTFRSEASALKVEGDRTATPRRSFYLQGLLVGASNPKAVLFFAAIFPQFLDPATPIAPQFAILALTFMAFEFGGADGLRTEHLAIGAAGAAERAGALGESHLRGIVRPDGRTAAADTPKRLMLSGAERGQGPFLLPTVAHAGRTVERVLEWRAVASLDIRLPRVRRSIMPAIEPSNLNSRLPHVLEKGRRVQCTKARVRH
ncbi:MAG: LysE family translocator [Janthinobacterium lividum]